MPRSIPAVATVGTLLVTLLGAAPAGAQAPYPQPYPQQYPQQPYPQQYPQQPQYPQPAPQQYPQYPQQPQYGQPYAPPAYGQPAYMPAPPSTGQFGEAGQFILSADRLFGVSIWSDNAGGDNNASDKLSGTSINLLYGNNNGVSGPYSTPRLGFDYTIVKSVSVGGSIGLIVQSSSRERSDGTNTTSTDLPSVLGFAIAPRGGYILAINPTISLWFRGGFTFFSLSQKQTVNAQSSSATLTGVALNLEPQLVVTPIPHFGFTAGLLGDIPLSGNLHQEDSQSNMSTDTTEKITNWGLALGLFGYL